MLRGAVYDRILLSADKPTDSSVEAWLTNAPAWAGYTGLVENGVLVHQYGPHAAGKLKLRYHLATDRITVAGSIQSFRYGHNSGSFSFAEARATCEAIAAALLLPPDALWVHVLENGVSAALTEPPAAFLSDVARATYGSLQTPFYAKEPPAGQAAPLLYTAGYEQYRIKIYDSGTYNRLRNKPAPTGPAIRFEILYRKSKKLASVLGWNGHLTLANLMQPHVFTRLSETLLASWHRIHLPATTMPAELTPEERMLLFSGANDPGFWEHLKRAASPATYKRKRALFKKLQSQAESKKALPYTVEIQDQIRRGLPD